LDERKERQEFGCKGPVANGKRRPVYTISRRAASIESGVATTVTMVDRRSTMTEAGAASHDHGEIDLLVCHLEDSSSGSVVLIVSQTHSRVVMSEDRSNTLAVI